MAGKIEGEKKVGATAFTVVFDEDKAKLHQAMMNVFIIAIEKHPDIFNGFNTVLDELGLDSEKDLLPFLEEWAKKVHECDWCIDPNCKD